MVRPSCRDALLNAAEAVVLEGGAVRLTLDAVADRAGVSKGGLLYHFLSKGALLEGMVARLIERGQIRRQNALAEMPPGPVRELKAELASYRGRNGCEDRVSAAILAAIGNEPELMKTIREYHSDRFSAHEKLGPLFERRALLLLAADGLFLMELLQVSPFSTTQRAKLIEELLTMSDELGARISETDSSNQTVSS